MRKFAFLSFVIAFIFLCAIPLHADDTDLFTIRVSPDALITLDLSLSMSYTPAGDWNYQVSSLATPDNPCTDTFTYPTYDTNHAYRCNSNGYIWADSACNGPFYKTSSGSHTTNCSKLEIAKRAIFDILDDKPDEQLKKEDEDRLGIRMGYMRFRNCTAEDSSVDYNSGCNTLQRGFDFDYNGLYRIIQAETYAGYTPLASQLKEAKKYLDDHKLRDDAKACRQKYIIMITDGWDTVACGGRQGVDENTSRSFSYKRRRATLAAVKDAIDAKYQVFVIGFGADMPQTERNTLNWVAFKGGTNNPVGTDSGATGAITFSSDPCQEYASCSPDAALPCSDPSNPNDLNCKQRNCANAPNDPGYKDLSGYAFLAQDATTLSQALKSIFRDITERAFFYTAPTIPSVRTVAGDIAYLSSFTPSNTPFWQGRLKAYPLNSDGTLPVDENGYINVDPIWDAFLKLNAKPHGSRLIYTSVNGLRRVFDDNLSLGDLGVGTDQDRVNLINHVRGGIDAYDVDQDGDRTELRSWKLGDIFHSNAVIIGKPSPSFIDPGYSGAGGFYETNKTRTKVVLVGANDGMLHAFHAGDWSEAEKKYDNGTGEEVWAFIPNALLPNLKLMAAAHTYYVDGSPRVSDVWFYSDSNPSGENKSGDEWKTVLISGLRKGGKHYFALNITNTLVPQYLWEFPSPNKNYIYGNVLAKIGQSWSDPAIGRVKIIEGNELRERWVAFIGGGFDKTDATGKAFFVLDITNGNILKEFSGLTGMDFSFAAPPTALDTNFDGYIDKVYIGDLGGQMWVFSVSSNNVAEWEGKILFKSGTGSSAKQSIYYQPAVALDPQRNLWVYFGTGDRENPTDDKTKDSFYAVKDDGKGDYPRREGSLVNVTSNNTFTIDPLKKGWYIELARGEKVLAKPAVFRKLLYFTTYSPNASTDPCNRAGNAAFYVVEYLSGGGALNLDEYIEGTPSNRSTVIGEGIPSTPVISVGPGGDAVVIVRTTSGGGGPGGGSGGPGGPGGGAPTAPPDENPKRVLYWREIVR